MIVQRRRRRVWVGSQGKLGLDRRVCGDGNCDTARRSDRRGTHGTLMGRMWTRWMSRGLEQCVRYVCAM